MNKLALLSLVWLVIGLAFWVQAVINGAPVNPGFWAALVISSVYGAADDIAKRLKSDRGLS